MMRRLIKLADNNRGATAIEYGLIVALIVIVIMSGISAVGRGSGGIWGNISTKVSNAMTAS